MTGPALVQSASGFSPVTLSATTTDNLLLLGVWYFADSPPIGSIDGWTFLASVDDGGEQGMVIDVWSRVSDGSEGGSYAPAIDWTGVDQFGGYHISIGEWGPVDPLLVDGLIKTGVQMYSGPLTLASITTTADDSVLLFYGFTQSDDLAGVTAPAGATDLFDGGSGGQYLGYEVINPFGATGSRSFDADPSDDTQVNIGIMFALAAEGATPPSGGPDVEISGETALVTVTAGTATAMTYTPARIGGVMRTVLNVNTIFVTRTRPDDPLALERTQPEPIVLDRDGPGAPIALTTTKGAL